MGRACEWESGSVGQSALGKPYGVPGAWRMGGSSVPPAQQGRSGEWRGGGARAPPWMNQV